MCVLFRLLGAGNCPPLRHFRPQAFQDRNRNRMLQPDDVVFENPIRHARIHHRLDEFDAYMLRLHNTARPVTIHANTMISTIPSAIHASVVIATPTSVVSFGIQPRTPRTGNAAA
jgi:hypothetical protein